MNKEEAHDAKISPLMTEIIAICREHGIAMVASYAIPTEEDESLRCTTLLPDGEGKPDTACQEAYNLIRRGTQTVSPMMLTTQHADGSKTLTAIFRMNAAPLATTPPTTNDHE